MDHGKPSWLPPQQVAVVARTLGDFADEVNRDVRLLHPGVRPNYGGHSFPAIHPRAFTEPLETNLESVDWLLERAAAPAVSGRGPVCPKLHTARRIQSGTLEGAR
jgi:hypothetical protein